MSTGILWHNSSSNETQIWFMNNNAITSRATVVDENTNKLFVGLPWSIVGTLFNPFAFGRPDIAWHNSSTNETQLWHMFNVKVSSRATVVDENDNKIFVGPPWSIVGTCNFIGDESAGILWHNSSSNETQIWFMNHFSNSNDRIGSRATVVDEHTNKIFVGPPWSIVGGGDFNGTSKADILWHNRFFQ